MGIYAHMNSLISDYDPEWFKPILVTNF